MAGEPLNLRPYGDSLTGGGPAAQPGTFEAAAQDRAMRKLNHWRAGLGGDRPAGPNLLCLMIALLFTLVPVGIFGLLPVWVAAKGIAVGALELGMFVATFVVVSAALCYLQTRPTSPKRTLNEFYRSLGRGQTKRAQKLVLPPDLDEFPRYQPHLPDLGEPTTLAYHFDDPTGFRAYWNGLVRAQTWPYCHVKISKLEEREIAPGIVVVDFELHLIMNTRLIFVVLVIAVIIDLLTRRTVRVPMRKVLVKVGNEWRLFNGEWMGYDEHDLNWARAASRPPGSVE